MGVITLLPHPLARLRDDAVSPAASDAYGQPVVAAAAAVTFRGFLQPRSSREVRQANEAGQVVSSHVLYAPAGLAIAKGDVVRRDPDDGARYFVEGDPRDAAGLGHHLEIDLRMVEG